MAGYDDAQLTIETALAQPVKRGFFGGIAEDDTLQQALPLLLQCYRQYVIKQQLQGYTELTGNEPDETATIETVEQFLQQRIEVV